ncbi:hypothetical protein G8O24_23380 [Bradyrhizobium sp. INPA01-394B]|uniref:Uncharacterized protein n=1 Tax=Bradyrhizobium campsiandrae TaxID=1729892 RepID=A0ABR7U4U0_9BRAD|nr:hypothetical protein [Bradyrhizobium campsiandrae]MBC9880272.1 hypothetical protein [Bradyrhizobium campsiandrae]MBC9978417.1 hypothetical protein [Bradyrhizobium campsiandrae]
MTGKSAAKAETLLLAIASNAKPIRFIPMPFLKKFTMNNDGIRQSLADFAEIGCVAPATVRDNPSRAQRCHLTSGKEFRLRNQRSFGFSKSGYVQPITSPVVTSIGRNAASISPLVVAPIARELMPGQGQLDEPLPVGAFGRRCALHCRFGFMLWIVLRTHGAQV